ncbi:MAG: TetR/AcrR family transcriptional regulator [Christensenellales bacterium]
MQEIKEDLRIRRTKKLLSITLLELMEEKPIEKISVTDICNKAMVHRTTFYSHFEDKYHLLSYVFQNIKEELFENLQNSEISKDLKSISIEINKVIIEFLTKNQKDIKQILKYNHNEKFYSILRESFERSLKALFIELKNEQMISYEIPLHILTTFIVGGFSNVVIYHMANPDNCNLSDLYNYVNIIIEQLTSTQI